MKRITLILTQIIVCVVILLGILFILFANKENLKMIVLDDIENISKLSSSVIYSEIENNLIKPIFVSQTMANDLFLKNWLAEEPASEEENSLIQDYLADYQENYGYDSVFLIPSKTNTYYYYKGINKVINPQDTHDVWYYDFLNSSKNYELAVDSDQVNNDALTLFVNCKIFNDNKELMGVVGVGVKMANLQELLDQYEKEYDLKAVLINKEGIVQVDSDEKNIERSNAFDDPEISPFKEEILNNTKGVRIFWYPEGGSDHCLIATYIEDLDWYIIIEKNTEVLQKELIVQMNINFLWIATIILLVLLIISYVIHCFNRLLLKDATTDDVTNLPNMRMFQEMFKRNGKREACHNGVLFIFDIDYFKVINDKYGHSTGNAVLYRVSEKAKEIITDHGLVARFGGDEFIGTIYGSEEKCKVLLKNLLKATSEIYKEEISHISISIGVTNMKNGLSLETLIKEADLAMYKAKEKGRNQILFYSELSDEIK